MRAGSQTIGELQARMRRGGYLKKMAKVVASRPNQTALDRAEAKRIQKMAGTKPRKARKPRKKKK